MVSMHYILLFTGILVTGNAFGQTTDWITEVTSDGSISVTYAVHEHKAVNGDKIQLLEYQVVSTPSLRFGSCLAVMRDESKHNQFMNNTTESRRIRDISNTEWLSYYYIDAPWPLPNYDCVTRYKVLNINDSCEIKLIANADPAAYPMQGVKRMLLNHSEYTFTDLGNGKVQIIIYSRIMPVVDSPEWMLKAWFPEGPANMMKGIIELAKQKEAQN